MLIIYCLTRLKKKIQYSVYGIARLKSRAHSSLNFGKRFSSELEGGAAADVKVAEAGERLLGQGRPRVRGRCLLLLPGRGVRNQQLGDLLLRRGSENFDRVWFLSLEGAKERFF